VESVRDALPVAPNLSTHFTEKLLLPVLNGFVSAWPNCVLACLVQDGVQDTALGDAHEMVTTSPFMTSVLEEVRVTAGPAALTTSKELATNRKKSIDFIW
jgi:hypothetical protein